MLCGNSSQQSEGKWLKVLARVAQEAVLWVGFPAPSHQRLALLVLLRQLLFP